MVVVRLTDTWGVDAAATIAEDRKQENDLDAKADRARTPAAAGFENASGT